MSNLHDMRKMNQGCSMAVNVTKEDKLMKVEPTKSAKWNVTEEDVKQIEKERRELESLYNIRLAMKSKESLLELAEKREAFFDKYHLALDDFVLFGKYLFAQDGTVKRIEVKVKLPARFPDLTPMKDFERSVTSFKTAEIKDFSAELSKLTLQN